VFALVALICFILALFKVHLGSLDLTVLGFCFVALHLMFMGIVPGLDSFRRRNP
jgi:hypothetical protein